jgi:UDP-N-acetylglucosamine diphosphorylase / glucose-1-phosphate thymidylyltransferase / UDP-N-acetylgalactosamine diphosphorylase / glucosamine-1-phosphate N-acetyltransferase / galactosamine-1-phosphate N-acetyltransferase
VWWREFEPQRGRHGLVDGEHPLRQDPTASVSPAALLDCSKGSISIGARTRICLGAYIEGPVTIGADCLIGNLAMVRGTTIIGDGSRIGFATEVKNAIIEDRVTIGPQCFIADSKIGHDAYLGAQVRTSNHRLDKRTVEVMIDGQRIDTGLEKLGCLIGARASLGIQVIILPGREIAPDSIFVPRSTIEKNLPAGRYRPAQRLELF